MASENQMMPGGGYELLDSGLEEKLERFGDFILARPDPQALWEKHLPESEWKKADAWYERAKGGSLPAGRQGDFDSLLFGLDRIFI